MTPYRQSSDSSSIRTTCVFARDGSTRNVRVPVATWMQHTQFDVPVEGGKRVRSATIDPDGVLPDVNRANNTFTAGVKKS